MDVIVPGRGGRARRKGIGIHRIKLSPTEVAVHDGIPVTTVARTLLDLADAVVSVHALKQAIHGAERVRLFDLRAVEALWRNAGRPGSRALAAALESYREPPMTRSALERVLFRLCATHGLRARP